MFKTILYLEIIQLKLLAALVGRVPVPRSELVDLILGGQLEHAVHTGLDNLGGNVYSMTCVQPVQQFIAHNNNSNI